MNSLNLPIAIDDLLRGQSVEWERLEYKAGWNSEDVLHTMCAFANDFHNLGGGYILIGVEEQNGCPVLPPKGIFPDQIDAIQKEILRLGHSAIQPSYHPLTTPAQIGDKTILVIWVPGGETRPYKAKISLSEKSSDWAWYIRKQSSTIRAKNADERELIGLAATVPFDDRYNQSASLDNLSLRLIEEYLKEVGSELAEQAAQLPMDTLGRQMNIVGGPSESPFPKNIGLMMFNEHPETFFPATQIDIVYFPDGPGGDIFEEKEFKGPLDRITRDALNHIQRNYLKETVIKYPDRAEADRIWNFPYAAVEEALVNAVYHRSYEIREPIEVRITPDELMVLSFPGPDRSIKIEDIATGNAVSRRYRNRRIGEFLKELDLTEGRSTGIAKIMRAIQHNGSPLPIFETDGDHSYFVVRFPVHPKSMRSVEAVTDGGERVPPQVAPQVPPQVIKLLSAMDDDMDRGQIQRALGLKDRKNFRLAYLSPALEAGLIEMTQPDTPSSPTQKYRLTFKGKQLREHAVS